MKEPNNESTRLTMKTQEMAMMKSILMIFFIFLFFILDELINRSSKLGILYSSLGIAICESFFLESDECLKCQYRVVM